MSGETNLLQLQLHNPMLLYCRSSLKGGSGIKNVSSAADVPGSWTPGSPVMVLTTSFTAMVFQLLTTEDLMLKLEMFQLATGRFTVSRAMGLAREAPPC